ncbi:MAG TPA: DUF6452 family protein [Flavobacterium sp.]|nr:DUF6452 family protein [Flavobacterium sp.]
MKRYLSRFFFLTLILGVLLGCEKDDICSGDTPTTPKLVINFYEFLNPSVSKQVLKLEIYRPESPDRILVFENTDQILLPLDTGDSHSTYVFRLTYQNINTILTNQDVFEVSYTKEDRYISRACGYMSNFVLDNSEPLNPNPKITDLADDLWIKECIIRQAVITNENETHLDILF